MANFLLKDIPGFTEALRAAAERDAAPRLLPFLGLDLEISGVRVKQFTPRHFLYLDLSGSPFIHGGPAGPAHVAQFLWIVSPEFSPDRVCRDVFISEIAHLAFAPALEAIHAYLDQAYQDAPTGRLPSGVPATYYLATMIDHLYEHGYPWSEDKILDTPFSALFQYFRRILLREEPDKKFDSAEVDKTKQAFVKKYLAAQSGQQTGAKA